LETTLTKIVETFAGLLIVGLAGLGLVMMGYYLFQEGIRQRIALEERAGVYTKVNDRRKYEVEKASALAKEAKLIGK
jgi:hypothetical protein